MSKDLITQDTVLDDPPIAKRLFGDTRLAWLWLPLRLKTAGWIRLDRWFLSMLGTPWRPGGLFKQPQSSPTAYKAYSGYSGYGAPLTNVERNDGWLSPSRSSFLHLAL